MPSVFVEGQTANLQRLLSPDPRVRATASALSAAEINALTAAARSDQESGVGVAPHRALALLAAETRPDVAVPVLEQVASSPTARTTNRIAALRGLARIATPAAETAIIAELRDAEPRIAIVAIAALGEISANREALTALDAVGPPRDAAVQRQLTLTRALIAHRLGLNGPFLPERTAQPRTAVAADRLQAVTLTMKTAEATAADVTKLTGPTYGVQPAARAYDLTCGRAQWTIFGNADLGASITSVAPLFERPWILALVARWQPVGVAAAVQYLVLSRPDGNGVRLDVVRGDGEIVYTGSAQPGGGTELAFSMTDVVRAATAPTTLAGIFDENSVRLDTAIVHAVREAVGQTQQTGR